MSRVRIPSLAPIFLGSKFLLNHSTFNGLIVIPLRAAAWSFWPVRRGTSHSPLPPRLRERPVSRFFLAILSKDSHMLPGNLKARLKIVAILGAASFFSVLVTLGVRRFVNEAVFGPDSDLLGNYLQVIGSI